MCHLPHSIPNPPYFYLFCVPSLFNSKPPFYICLFLHLHCLTPNHPSLYARHCFGCLVLKDPHPFFFPSLGIGSLLKLATSNIGKHFPLSFKVNYHHHSWALLLHLWFAHPPSPKLVSTFFYIIKLLEEFECVQPPLPLPMNCNALCFMELHDPPPSQCIALSMLSC